MDTNEKIDRPVVLLVDDDPVFHHNLEFALQGFDVQSAYNETEAKELGTKFELDLIILDLNLDKFTDDFLGLELVEYFHKLKPEVPIITVTNYYEMDNLEEEALSRGAKLFLLKKDYEDDWKKLFEENILKETKN